MKKFMVLFRTNMRRNILAIAISVLGAVVLCFGMTAFCGMADEFTHSYIGIVDKDKSELSGSLKNYLEDKLNYKLVESDDYDYLSKILIKRQIAVIIEVPKGFQEGAVKDVFKDMSITALNEYANMAFVKSYLDSYMSSVRTMSVAANGNETAFLSMLSDADNISIPLEKTFTSEKSLDTLKSQAAFQSINGFYAFIAFAFGIVIAITIYEDRKRGTYSRIQLTSVRPSHYIASTVLTGMVLQGVMLAILYTYIGAKNYDIGVNVGVMALVSLLYALFTIAFCIFVALTFNSRQGIITSVCIGGNLFCIIGGCYFPINSSSKVLDNLSKFMPPHWYTDAYQNLLAGKSITVDIVVLILFIGLFSLLGMYRFTKQNKIQ